VTSASTGTGALRIAIAEDHRIVADALATMLSFAEGFEVVGTVASGADILELAATSQPDIVLMDVKLDGLNGIEATRELVRRDPDAKVLVLSMHDDQDTVTDAIVAGAAGFLPKNVERDELVNAIRAVADGAGFLHPTVTRPFLHKMGAIADKARARETLTDRERTVLTELAQGKSTKEIAETLVVGEETVKTHLTHIYQKLGVNDRVQAVAIALRRGLVH
jgi:two-component system response regulator DegU